MLAVHLLVFGVEASALTFNNDWEFDFWQACSIRWNRFWFPKFSNVKKNTKNVRQADRCAKKYVLCGQDQNILMNYPLFSRPTHWRARIIFFWQIYRVEILVRRNRQRNPAMNLVAQFRWVFQTSSRAMAIPNNIFFSLMLPDRPFFHHSPIN